MNAISIPDRPATLFMHEIVGDSMAPTYVPGRAVEQYLCEGVYLINGIDLCRCQREGRYIRAWRDKSAYQEYSYHIDLFNAADLALVCADVRITNPTMFRAAKAA